MERSALVRARQEPTSACVLGNRFHLDAGVGVDAAPPVPRFAPPPGAPCAPPRPPVWPSGTTAIDCATSWPPACALPCGVTDTRTPTATSDNVIAVWWVIGASVGTDTETDWLSTVVIVNIWPSILDTTPTVARPGPVLGAPMAPLADPANGVRTLPESAEVAPVGAGGTCRASYARPAPNDAPPVAPTKAATASSQMKERAIRQFPIFEGAGPQFA
jgi:hypothetical protein